MHHALFQKTKNRKRVISLFVVTWKLKTCAYKFILDFCGTSFMQNTALACGRIRRTLSFQESKWVIWCRGPCTF